MNKRATNHLRAFGLHRRRFFFVFLFFIWNSLHWRAETMTIEILLYGVFQNVAAYKKA